MYNSVNSSNNFNFTATPDIVVKRKLDPVMNKVRELLYSGELTNRKMKRIIKYEFKGVKYKKVVNDPDSNACISYQYRDGAPYDELSKNYKKFNLEVKLPREKEENADFLKNLAHELTHVIQRFTDKDLVENEIKLNSDRGLSRMCLGDFLTITQKYDNEDYLNFSLERIKRLSDRTFKEFSKEIKSFFIDTAESEMQAYKMGIQEDIRNGVKDINYIPVNFFNAFLKALKNDTKIDISDLEKPI